MGEAWEGIFSRCKGLVQSLWTLRMTTAARSPRGHIGLEPVSVLILARNEGGNLHALLDSVRRVLDATGHGYEIVVVDGDSVDDTVAIARQHGAIIVPQQSEGYGGALREGLKACTGEFIFTLDADHSHDPSSFREMLDAGQSADVVIGSRYVPSGRVEMPAVRKGLSMLLNRVFSTTLGLDVKDLSSGFRLYRRSAIERLSPRARHFDVIPELTAQAVLRGLRVREVPIHFRPREAGVSKARVLKFGPHYARTLLRCVSERRARSNLR